MFGSKRREIRKLKTKIQFLEKLNDSITKENANLTVENSRLLKKTVCLADSLNIAMHKVEEKGVVYKFTQVCNYNTEEYCCDEVFEYNKRRLNDLLLQSIGEFILSHNLITYTVGNVSIPDPNLSEIRAVIRLVFPNAKKEKY